MDLDYRQVWTDMHIVLACMVLKGSQCMHSLFKFLPLDWSLLHTDC